METKLYSSEKKHFFGLKTKPAVYLHNFDSIKEFLYTDKVNPSKFKNYDIISLDNLIVERKGEDQGLIESVYPVILRDNTGKIKTNFDEGRLDLYLHDFGYEMDILREGDILDVKLLYDRMGQFFEYDVLSFKNKSTCAKVI